MDEDLKVVLFLLAIVGVWILGWLFGRSDVSSFTYGISGMTSILGLFIVLMLICEGLYRFFEKHIQYIP